MGTVHPLGEHERTLACAQLALGKIKDLERPCDPRAYAAWFAYATGCSPSQNSAVDQAVALTGDISPEELERIYGYAPVHLTTEAAGNLAAAIELEVRQVVAMIDMAVATIAAYHDDLAKATGRLEHAADRQAANAALESLARATNLMRRRNEACAARLLAAKEKIARLQHESEPLRQEQFTDALTSVANRQAFDRELERCLREANARGEPLCLLLMDIDHLDKVNNSLGTLAGDEVLRVVAHALKRQAQSNDVVARVGCDEFAVILPNIPLRSALTVADHIRCRVMATHLMKRTTGESMGRVTLSGGIAEYRTGDDACALMRRADGCLEAAKRHGRNRVICETDGLVAGSA
jgi:diguanylate cyclase